MNLDTRRWVEARGLFDEVPPDAEHDIAAYG